MCLTVAFCYFERRPLIICSIGISQNAFFHSMTLSFSGPLLSRSYVCNAFLRDIAAMTYREGGHRSKDREKRGSSIRRGTWQIFLYTLSIFLPSVYVCRARGRLYLMYHARSYWSYLVVAAQEFWLCGLGGFHDTTFERPNTFHTCSRALTYTQDTRSSYNAIV